MIRNSHSPQDIVTQPTPFTPYLNNPRILRAQPGINIEDALALACEYLSHARATACESADNSTAEFEPLARAMVRQVETARALVEASIAGLWNASQTPRD